MATDLGKRVYSLNSLCILFVSGRTGLNKKRYGDKMAALFIQHLVSVHLKRWNTGEGIPGSFTSGEGVWPDLTWPDIPGRSPTPRRLSQHQEKKGALWEKLCVYWSLSVRTRPSFVLSTVTTGIWTSWTGDLLSFKAWVKFKIYNMTLYVNRICLSLSLIISLHVL